MAWIPGIQYYVQSILNLNPLVKFYTFLQPFQVVLLGFLIKKVFSHKEILVYKKQKWLGLTALLLSFFYASLLTIAIASQLIPKALGDSLRIFFTWLASLFTSFETGNIIGNIAKENIFLFAEKMDPSYFLFYGATFCIMVLFTTTRWTKAIKYRGGIPFIVLLLLNNNPIPFGPWNL